MFALPGGIVKVIGSRLWMVLIMCSLVVVETPGGPSSQVRAATLHVSDTFFGTNFWDLPKMGPVEELGDLRKRPQGGSGRSNNIPQVISGCTDRSRQNEGHQGHRALDRNWRSNHRARSSCARRQRHLSVSSTTGKHRLHNGKQPRRQRFRLLPDQRVHLSTTTTTAGQLPRLGCAIP